MDEGDDVADKVLDGLVEEGVLDSWFAFDRDEAVDYGKKAEDCADNQGNLECAEQHPEYTVCRT